MDIPFAENDIPFLDQLQMIEVDRLMIQDYRIELIQMMENAGRNLAHLARIRFLENNPIGKQIVVLAGSGGNGGGAMVCARHLHNWGAEVVVFIIQPAEEYSSDPAHQLDILRRMNIPVKQTHDLQTAGPYDLIIDGLLGYSLNGAPHGTAADYIRWSNQQNTLVLSLDIPSGVDPSNGVAFEPAIHATATMTLALPQKGLRAPGIQTFVGELYLADIGVPPELYIGISTDLKLGSLFATSRSEERRVG